MCNLVEVVRKYCLKTTMQDMGDMLGVSKQTVFMWESGRMKIPKTRQKQILSLTGLPECYLNIEDFCEKEILILKEHFLKKELEEVHKRIMEG